MYIYQSENWPHFVFDEVKILKILAEIKLRQGILIGRMQNLGFAEQSNSSLEAITEEIMKSSLIEGQLLEIQGVRSSVARKLGLPYKNIPVPRNAEGMTETIIDAVKNYNKTIDRKRLCGWHKNMFPDGISGWNKIKAGCYRDDSCGAMQVVSGAIGHEKVCYEAPPAAVIPQEMQKLFDFINNSETDNIIKAAIAHLWFVILHPFEDGNGRIARALSEMLLARSEQSQTRFYSMSSQIARERKEYYSQLEITGRAELDITSWLVWFLECLGRAIGNSENLLKKTLEKSSFWREYQGKDLNPRQEKIINMLFDGFTGNLTSRKWGKLCKCSHDTATRDINALVKAGILMQHGQGRSTHYVLAWHEK